MLWYSNNIKSHLFFLLILQSTSKGHVIVAKIVEHLHLVEKDYFGLRYLDSTNQTVSIFSVV